MIQVENARKAVHYRFISLLFGDPSFLPEDMVAFEKMTTSQLYYTVVAFICRETGKQGSYE